MKARARSTSFNQRGAGGKSLQTFAMSIVGCRPYFLLLGLGLEIEVVEEAFYGVVGVVSFLAPVGFVYGLPRPFAS